MNFKHVLLATTAALFLAGTAQADMTTQQNRMASCNQQAKADGKTGADRKAFMKSCLSGQSVSGAAATAAAAPAAAAASANTMMTRAAAAPAAAASAVGGTVSQAEKNAMTPQDRMRYCNKQATGMKGDPRKDFMKQCLKKS